MNGSFPLGTGSGSSRSSEGGSSSCPMPAGWRQSLCWGNKCSFQPPLLSPLSGSFKDTLHIERESTLISYDLMLILNYNSRNSASKSYSFLKIIFIEKIMGFILTFSYMHTRYTLQSCLPRSYSLVLFPIPAGPTLTFSNFPFCFHTPHTQT